MDAPIIQQNNDQLGQLANLLKNVSPEFGSGKTTESQQSSTNTGDADELLKQIYASANPNDIDNMIENILNRAKQAFGPAAIGSNAAGIRAYSDTTETQLRNEAMARATGEAASSKLAAINNAHKTAATVVDAKMQNTRKIESQKKTGMSPVGTGLLVGLGASVIKNKLKGKGGAAEAAGNSTAVDNSSYSRNEYGQDNVANFPGDTGENVAISPTPIVNAVDVNAGAGVDEVPPAIEAATDAVDTTDFAPGLEMTDETPVAAEDVGAAVDEVAPDLVDEEGSSTLEDIFGGFFADGGVVPGTRAAPGAYEPGVLDAAKNTQASKQTTLAPELSEPEILNVIKAQPPAQGKKQTTSAPGAVDNGAGGGGTSAASFSAGPEGGSFGSFSPSAAGIAMAAMHAATGNPAAAVMSLTASALANALGTSTVTDTTAATTEDAALGASMTAESNAAAADFASAMSSDSNTGLAGFMGGDMGFSGTSDAGSPDAGGDASFAGAGSSGDAGGGSDGGGDGGGGDGGGEADGGIIHGQTAADSEGIDRVVIHVTPGEAVLPADTVAALGGPDGIDELIRQTHRKVKRGR